jgi:hypothetical protein
MNKTMALKAAKELISFEGKGQKVVSFDVFEKTLKIIGMNWYGIKNWSRMDLDLFEQKLDGLTCEPFESGMNIWDRNFDYSDLQKL